MKNLFLLNILILMTFSQATFAETFNVGEAILDENGKVISMTFPQAEEACARSGSRLPTAYEAAKWAQQLGAFGIVETAFPHTPINQKIREEREQYLQRDFLPIYGANENNETTLEFYFKDTGFKKSDELSSDYYFWTSTKPAIFKTAGYIMNATFGMFVIVSYGNDRFMSTRCVKNE